MPCKWELILQVLLPLVSPGFDVYTVGPSSAEYQKLAGPASSVCEAAKLVLAPESGLKPFETEQPVDVMQARIRSLPGIEVLKLVNRKGPFFGYYLEVRQAADDGA
jgi:hypothetical protein